MARRNPLSPWAWAGIATGVAALATGVTVALTREPKKKKKKAKVTVVPTSERDCATLYGSGTPAYEQCLIDIGLKKPPRGGEEPVPNYVGSGWDWPRKDEFPNESSFGFALSALGYEVGDYDAPSFRVTSQLVMAAVESFQKDYNVVKNESEIFGVPVPEFLKRANLSEDGLIGKNTIDAIIDALRYQNESDNDWPQVVSEARKRVA